MTGAKLSGSLPQRQQEPYQSPLHFSQRERSKNHHHTMAEKTLDLFCQMCKPRLSILLYSIKNQRTSSTNAPDFLKTNSLQSTAHANLCDLSLYNKAKQCETEQGLRDPAIRVLC